MTCISTIRPPGGARSRWGSSGWIVGAGLGPEGGKLYIVGTNFIDGCDYNVGAVV